MGNNCLHTYLISFVYVFRIYLETFELSIPWRKIRRFTEIVETKTISFEIFIAADQAFTWVEVQSIQGTLLLQITAEFIDQIRRKLEKPIFRQPKWVDVPKANTLSWKMIKTEIFGVKKGKNAPFMQAFDVFDGNSSDEEVLEISNVQNKQNKKYLPDIRSESLDDGDQIEKNIRSESLDDGVQIEKYLQDVRSESLDDGDQIENEDAVSKPSNNVTTDGAHIESNGGDELSFDTENVAVNSSEDGVQMENNYAEDEPSNDTNTMVQFNVPSDIDEKRI